jgi:hypothetical protein
MGESLDARIAGYIPKTRARASAVAQAIKSPIGFTINP